MNKIFLLLFFSLNVFSQEFKTIQVNPHQEFIRLVHQLDTDHDQKITKLDKIEKGFKLQDKKGETYQVHGHYFLSNLMQELKLLDEAHQNRLDGQQIFENPVARISRSIRERYWDGLTRRVDEDHLKKVLPDSKVETRGRFYLYVPHGDEVALNYYRKAAQKSPHLKLNIIELPAVITPQYVQSLNGKHGLLTLALERDSRGELRGVPYVVPGGRFNEMYGWDSYFEALGLIQDDRIDLAKAMVDNFVFEITHYGKILNANRTYYLTRSQPPFLTSMIRAVYPKLEGTKLEKRRWLETSLRAALKEYQEVWMGKDRLTHTGLSRYQGFAPGIPPEVEPHHYDPILLPYAKKRNLSLKKFQQQYESGAIKEPELDEFFLHDRAVRESGHDTTYRWRVEDKDTCANFATVDLNSLLLKYELDFAYLIKHELNDHFPLHSSYFLNEAKKRKNLIRTFLWDEKKSLFLDYDFARKTRSSYISATTFYPLWAYDPTYPELALLSKAEAAKMIQTALKELEAPGGVAATALSSLKLYGDEVHQRQWDYPNGWAPHQMLIWQGLMNYGFDQDAQRLIYKWLAMITTNAADFNGTVPEKYDVVNRTHAVFAEYGNVGTHFSYITREGFGWMNASYQVGLSLLAPEKKKQLERMVDYKDLK